MWKRLRQAFKITLSLLLVSVLAGVFGNLFYSSKKTNRIYLIDIIDKHYSEKIAAEIISKAREGPHKGDFSNADWENVEHGLAKCLDREEKEYLESNDPYLNEKANMESPKVLSGRFLKSCGALD